MKDIPRKKMKAPCGFNCESRDKSILYHKKFKEIGYKFVEKIYPTEDGKYFSTFLVANTENQLLNLLKQYEKAIKGN